MANLQFIEEKRRPEKSSDQLQVTQPRGDGAGSGARLSDAQTTTLSFLLVLSGSFQGPHAPHCAASFPDYPAARGAS